MDAKKQITTIKDLIKKHNIKFGRGDIETYFGYLSQVSFGLTLPPSKPNWRAVYLKNVYTLWNITVDDELDRAHSNTELNACFDFIATNNTSLKSTFLLEIMLAELGEYSEMAKQDILEMLTAFNFEFLINSQPYIANTQDYIRYSTMTASIKYFLLVDLALSNIRLSNAEFGALRNGYHHFSTAIKLSSDLGSFQREITEEKNLNYPLILLIEKDKVAPNKIFSLSPTELHSAAKPYFPEIKKLIQKEYKKGLTSLERISTIKIDIFIETVANVITRYSNETDPFFLQV